MSVEPKPMKPKPPNAFDIATQWPVVRRSLIMAVIVGSILVTINHGMCITKAMFNMTCLFQSVLTFFVPYAVSTVSSVLAIMDRRQRKR